MILSWPFVCVVLVLGVPTVRTETGNPCRGGEEFPDFGGVLLMSRNSAATIRNTGCTAAGAKSSNSPFTKFLTKEPESALQVLSSLVTHTLSHLSTIIVIHDDSSPSRRLVGDFLLLGWPDLSLIVATFQGVRDEPPSNNTWTGYDSLPSENEEPFPGLSTPYADGDDDENGDLEATRGSASFLSAREYSTPQTGAVIITNGPRSLQELLSPSPGDWNPNSIVLLNVNGRENVVPWSSAMPPAVHSVLLQPSVTSRGKPTFRAINYLPFAPAHAQFAVQTFDPARPLSFGQLFLDRFPNFHAHHFLLASDMDDYPFLFYMGENNTKTGVGITMLGEIASRLNFTFQVFHSAPDADWGELVNGSWTGLLGEVMRGEKDFIINAFDVIHERYSVIDFSIQYTDDAFAFVARVPPPLPRWRTMMYPFDLETWLALIASVVVVTAFFHAFVRESAVKIYDHECDVLSSMLWMLRAILRQSVPAEPSFAGSRLFLVCWWLAAFIVATSYTGNLVAFITVPAKAKKIQTLDELGKSDLQLEMLDYGEYIPGYLATSDVPVLSRLGNRLHLVDDYAVTFEGIRQGTHALLEALAYMEYVVVTEGVGINIYMIKEKFAKNNLAWIFPRGTPWKHKVDWCLNQFVESGLVNYWKRNALKEFRQSEGLHPLGLTGEEEEEEGERPLNLEELQGSFFILAIGLGSSFLVLLIEIAFDRTSKF